MIKTVHFDRELNMGPQAEPAPRLHNGVNWGEYKVQLDFDDDSRFIRVLLTKENKRWEQLVSFNVISSIVVEPDGRRYTKGQKA